MDNGELNNRRVLALAKAHKCRVARVHEALDEHPVNSESDRFLRRTLALELMRLDQLEEAFEGKAIRDEDVASGMLLTKIMERRQILLGLAAPAGHAVTVIAREELENSTERIRAAIDRIRAMPKRANGDGSQQPD